MPQKTKVIRKPCVKLVEISGAFPEDGAWRQFFGDSKGRVYRRSKRGSRETWTLVSRVCEGEICQKKK